MSEIEKQRVIPDVMFGTTSFGNIFRVMPDETKREIVGKMLEIIPGTIAFDSAGKYGAGLALESLAETLAHFRVPPERVVISNKLAWRRIPLATQEPTFEPGVWVDLKNDAVQDISYDGILRCWVEGNDFLGDYNAEILSVHDPDEYLDAAKNLDERQSRWDDILGAYRALEELRANGEAKAVGVGVKKWRVAKEITDQRDLDWVMIAGCFTVYQHEQELLDFLNELRDRGIAVINSAVYHGGFLTGGEFFNYRKIDPTDSADVAILNWRDKFHHLCSEFNVSPAASAVEFAVSPPGIVSIAVNNSRAKYVEKNARIANARHPDAFWDAMKQEGLVRSDYPHVGSTPSFGDPRGTNRQA